MNACMFGTHRVIKPLGVLPQASDILDNTMVCQDTEMLLEVETLNIDSASFTQIKEATQGDVKAMKAMILSIVSARGKMQNPVTGSGGMLIGKVIEKGEKCKHDVNVNDTIATLVSLSLTPLLIEEIKAIDLSNDQVHIKGKAILFQSGIFAKVPNDMDAHVALAALDVAGAPAQVNKLVKENQSVLIIGAAGKSGILCAYQAKKNAGPNGKVIGLVYDEAQKAMLEPFGYCDSILVGDAREPMAIYGLVKEHNQNEQVDVCINVVNVPGTEMASIITTKSSGIVYFFSMATHFAKAALGAEGIGSDVTMIIGNGYTLGHAELTLNILREEPKLFDLFQNRYAKRG